MPVLFDSDDQALVDSDNAPLMQKDQPIGINDSDDTELFDNDGKTRIQELGRQYRA